MVLVSDNGQISDRIQTAAQVGSDKDAAMDWGIIYHHAQSPVPLLPIRFARYQALLNMMLAKKPEDRLQSAAEIEEWL